MRQQYHSRPTPDGIYIWDVHKLVTLTKNITPKEVQLSDIAELDENYWFEDGSTPTPRAIAAHMKLVHETDLAHPIILCPEGRVMDGMHRCVKALLERNSTILAVQLSDMPQPDYIDVPLDELPYD